MKNKIFTSTLVAMLLFMPICNAEVKYNDFQFQECIEVEGTDNLDDDFNVCVNMFEYENGIIK